MVVTTSIFFRVYDDGGQFEKVVGGAATASTKHHNSIRRHQIVTAKLEMDSLKLL